MRYSILLLQTLVVFTSFMGMVGVNGLSSAIRFRENIILNVTFNRIASLLLPGGRTAHSRFTITIIITDESTCNIKHDSLKAELLI
ncbi:hypothetical protein Ahy_B05g078101 [Arachis hypogaea]|uniref:ATP-dependent DNA helicase n=1 Tax=Arachis hypogaea TaxID=3818 RepID=A0A444Z6B1_ARAHY|nr:hypothetical protein Ahy_B05g078101 [Arachis hypogaea]